MSAKRRATTGFSSSRPARAREAPPQNAVQNLLLASLPPAVYHRVAGSLQTRPLFLKQVLQESGEPLEHVYFPGGGFCSVLTLLADGSMVEVATVGREGMLGVSAILDQPHSWPSVTMVQAATDTSYRMPVDAFRREFERRGPFYTLLTRYAVAHLGFVMQSTACNAKHSVEQRLARWLLLAHDRVGQDQFPLTQEFVAMMLGASRPMVTAIASRFQGDGLITYYRGILRITHRGRLERTACECYRTTTLMLSGVTDEFRSPKKGRVRGKST